MTSHMKNNLRNAPLRKIFRSLVTNEAKDGEQKEVIGSCRADQGSKGMVSIICYIKK